jgi:Tol biopolymer transport system component
MIEGILFMVAPSSVFIRVHLCYCLFVIANRPPEAGIFRPGTVSRPSSPTAAWPLWSPTGTTIGFIRGLAGGEHELNTVTADGATLVPIEGEYVTQFDWSPTGAKLVYSRVVPGGQPGGEFDIYMANADGTGHTNLTPEAGDEDREPRWSRTGRRSCS